MIAKQTPTKQLAAAALAVLLLGPAVSLTGSLEPFATESAVSLGTFEGAPLAAKAQLRDARLACAALHGLEPHSRDYQAPIGCDREGGLDLPPGTCDGCDPSPLYALSCADGSPGLAHQGADLACASEAGRYAQCVVVPLLPVNITPIPLDFGATCEPGDETLCKTAVADLCAYVPHIVESIPQEIEALGPALASAMALTSCDSVPWLSLHLRCGGSGGPAPPKTPRPDGIHCEDRQSTGAGGAWSLVIPTADLGPSSPPSMAGFTSYASLSLDIPDAGTNSQRICYKPGTWDPVSPPTREPPSADAIAAKQHECDVSMMIFAVGAAVAIAGAFKGNPGVVMAGVGMMATGAAMSGACAEAEAMRDDPGYMKCVGHAQVTWGGANGNSFDHAILSTGILAVSSHSDGPGYREENFPPLNKPLFDAEGYHYGNETACPGNMEANNQAAWDRFLEYMDTTSTSGSAKASLDVAAHIAGTGAVFDPLFRLAPGVFTTSAGNLVFGCSTTVCDVQATISIESCGQQVMAANANQVQYSFIGKAGCTTLAITVNGRAVTVTLPLVRLDGSFGGEGNTIIGGGALGAILATV
ncbi:MAG: hypothetical protein QOD77_1775 [Thermoplasmata archaeon]|nr:hypothetical protein [Thermoplasmata archaeon]